jgi:pyruvate kinase
MITEAMLSEKKTKIVCTIGPATETKEKLTELLNAGMNVMRLNFSHGDFAEHQARVNSLREVMKKEGFNAAILQDLAGPKIRIGDFKDGKVELVPGKFITLTSEKIVGDATRVHCNYPKLAKELKVGSTVLLQDGRKRLEVVSIKGSEVKCKIIVGGEISGRKGVNLPGANLSISAITEKDRADLAFGIKNDVDFIALSFVRRPSDIVELRGILNKAKCTAKIIAKIETPEAVENIDAIIELVDGIMVARGDLAIEIPTETVPLTQKMIIEKCNRAGKPVITATQMLESMIKSPIPTRAEVSDVANAIVDGTDAIMLSEETTLGQYPVEAVKVMTKVALQIEKGWIHEARIETHGGDVINAVSGAVVEVAHDAHAKFIVALTRLGGTARMISRFKPTQPIIAFTPNEKTYHQLMLSYGCTPVLIPDRERLGDASQLVRDYIKDHKLAKKGDHYILTVGLPFAKPIWANTLIVETV